jgi:hypothetical protein
MQYDSSVSSRQDRVREYGREKRKGNGKMRSGDLGSGCVFRTMRGGFGDTGSTRCWSERGGEVLPIGGHSGPGPRWPLRGGRRANCARRLFFFIRHDSAELERRQMQRAASSEQRAGKQATCIASSTILRVLLPALSCTAVRELGLPLPKQKRNRVSSCGKEGGQGGQAAFSSQPRHCGVAEALFLERHLASTSTRAAKHAETCTSTRWQMHR